MKEQKAKAKTPLTAHFDASVSNPPFQDTTNRNTTPHKLWIDFTHREYELLKVEGSLAQISPSSFCSPSSKVLPYFLKNQTEYLGLDTDQFFDVGSTFADYIILKQPRYKDTNIVNPDGSKSKTVLDHNIFYLPNDFCGESLSIHKKVIFTTTAKLNVQFDYVTCHNVLIKNVNPVLSKTKTLTHIYPIFHTNPQIWWSNVQQSFATQKKVMWTRSGYTKPFYDNGVYGTTDMGYYVLVADDTEGEVLAHNLNTMLFKYILKTAKWSGFGNELVFQSLPDLPKTKLTDSQMFAHWNISATEIAYIQNYLNPPAKIKSKVEKTIDTSIDRNQSRVSVTAEVFTCDALADRLVAEMNPEHFRNSTHKILESSAGNGQLVLAILRRMKAEGRTDWKHIIERQLYLCEYMKDNIEELITRLSDFVGFDITTVNHNIIWADFLSVTSISFDITEWQNMRFTDTQPDRLTKFTKYNVIDITPHLSAKSNNNLFDFQ